MGELTSEDTVAKTATINTSKGTIVAELFDKEVPNTVQNFEKLANSEFYDGTRFQIRAELPASAQQGGTVNSSLKKHERVTWRLDPSNYEFVNNERMRMRLTSMNAALNVILAEHRQKCCQSDSTVTAKRQHSDSKVTAL